MFSNCNQYKQMKTLQEWLNKRHQFETTQPQERDADSYWARDGEVSQGAFTPALCGLDLPDFFVSSHRFDICEYYTRIRASSSHYQIIL